MELWGFCRQETIPRKCRAFKDEHNTVELKGSQNSVGMLEMV